MALYAQSKALLGIGASPIYKAARGLVDSFAQQRPPVVSSGGGGGNAHTQDNSFKIKQQNNVIITLLANMAAQGEFV